MKLNIGAGTTRYDGFVNCDHSDLFNPEYIFDLEKDTWPFESNTVDEVIAHHVLEHMGEGYFHCLKELYRVCKNGALIDIRVPHYRNENQSNDPTHRRPITQTGLSLFSKKYNRENMHGASKLGLMHDIDFEIIECEHTLNTWHPLYDHLSKMNQDDLSRYAYDKVNVFDETHIKLKVVKGDRKDNINAYYLYFLNRNADEESLNYYANSQLSLEQIRDAILNSEEYNNYALKNKKILITTTRSILLFDIKTKNKKVIHRGFGPYYGVCVKDNFVYVSARKKNQYLESIDIEKNVILKFDMNLKFMQEIVPPCPIRDVHGIASDESSIYITSTYDNCIMVYNNGQWESWNPLENNKYRHYNSLFIDNDKIYILAHNRGESELFCFDKLSKSLISATKLGNHAHTIWKENNSMYVCDSMNGRIVSNSGFNLITGGFPRGYVKLENIRLVGLSSIVQREERHVFNEKSVTPSYIQYYDKDWQKLDEYELASEGQIYELFYNNILD